MDVEELRRLQNQKREAKKMKFSESTTTIHMDREVADFARNKAKEKGISLKQYLEDCVIAYEMGDNYEN